MTSLIRFVAVGIAPKSTSTLSVIILNSIGVETHEKR